MKLSDDDREDLKAVRALALRIMFVMLIVLGTLAFPAIFMEIVFRSR